MSATKDELVENIKQWIAVEQEIQLIQKELKHRKERKKILTSNLVDIMKTNEIDCFDVNNGKIVYTSNKTRSPMNKQHLYDCLSKHFSDSSDENVEELTNFIMKSRKIKTTDKIQYKLPK